MMNSTYIFGVVQSQVKTENRLIVEIEQQTPCQVCAVVCEEWCIAEDPKRPKLNALKSTQHEGVTQSSLVKIITKHNNGPASCSQQLDDLSLSCSTRVSGLCVRHTPRSCVNLGTRPRGFRCCNASVSRS